MEETEIKRISLRLPVDIHEQANEAAKEDRRSLHAEILILLQEALEARNKAKPKAK